MEVSRVIRRIAEPAADDRLRDVINRRLKKHNSIGVGRGEVLGVCVVRFRGPAMPDQAAYAAIKTAMEAIDGVEQVEILIDLPVPDATRVPAGDTLQLVVDAQLRSDKPTAAEPAI